MERCCRRDIVFSLRQAIPDCDMPWNNIHLHQIKWHRWAANWEDFPWRWLQQMIRWLVSFRPSRDQVLMKIDENRRHGWDDKEWYVTFYLLQYFTKNSSKFKLLQVISSSQISDSSCSLAQIIYYKAAAARFFEEASCCYVPYRWWCVLISSKIIKEI